MAVETIRIEIPIESIDKTDPGIRSVIKKLEEMSQAEEKAGNSADKARGHVSKFDRSSEKTQRSLSKWAKEKYEVLLEAKEKISPILLTLGGKLRNLGGKAWNVTLKALDFVTSPVRGVINLLRNPIFQVGSVLGVSLGMKDTIDTYKNFESAMSNVSAISGATGTDLDKLTQRAKDLGAATKYTAEEVAGAYSFMGMAGWNSSQMLDGIEGILNLSAASGEAIASVSDIVTDALTAFNMKASDANMFADVLAATASSANTTVSGMGETFKYAGAMAGSLGYSIQDVALATGLMANAGIKNSMAGTALNAIFTRLSTDAGASSKSLGALGVLTEKLGVEFYDSKRNARDLGDVLKELRKATKGMNDEEKTYYAKKIAGMQAQKGLLAILNASDADFKKLEKSISNSEGAAAKMSETMQDNLAGSITKFQSALDGVKLSLGERFAPYVRGIADWLTGSMPGVSDVLDDIMDSVDMKVDAMKRKFKEITSTDEWNNADFFGKVKISWDKFIAEPFSEWWESTGSGYIAGKMADIGRGLGGALNAGILTLLGFDVSDTLNEGANIGASFAKGFVDGFDFDTISKKLWDGMKNMVANASKLLPGGESADLSSVLSAAMLAKIASPLISASSGAASLVQGLSGGGGGSMLGTIFGSAGAGTGLAGLGANTAISLGAGNLAGGASLSAGALSGIGLGAIAGGVVGGAALVSGGMDIYNAVNADSLEEQDAYAGSAALEVDEISWEGEFFGKSKREEYIVDTDNYLDPNSCVKLLNKLMLKNTVVTLVISTTWINMDVTIASFEATPHGAFGNVKYSITFKKYRDLEIKTTKEAKKSTKKKTTKSRNKKKKNKSSSTVSYVVKSGDTLIGITRKICGSASKWTAIYNKNKKEIEAAAKKHGRKNSSHGHWIYPGTKLTIFK